MDANAHNRMAVLWEWNSNLHVMTVSDMISKSFGWCIFTLANAHAVIDRYRSSNAPKSRVTIAEAILSKRSVWLCSPIFAKLHNMLARCWGMNSSKSSSSTIWLANASKTRGHDATSHVAYAHKTFEMPCGSNELAFSMIFLESLSSSSACAWSGRMRTLDYSAILPPCAATRGSRLKCLPWIEMSAMDWNKSACALKFWSKIRSWKIDR
jgi:hypothetical protein